MDTFTVVFDACVLYPAPLRDVLLELSVEGLFHPRWTNEIHDEWTRNVLAKNPRLTPEKLQRTRELMNAAVRDCLITGYEMLVDSLELPDPDDRHVLAAAIVAKAGAIVTFNVRHFPQQILEEFGLEAQHPDDFLMHQFGLQPAVVSTAIKRLRARLKNPPMNPEEYLACLLRQQLPQFVEKLRLYGGLTGNI